MRRTAKLGGQRAVTARCAEHRVRDEIAFDRVPDRLALPSLLRVLHAFRLRSELAHMVPARPVLNLTTPLPAKRGPFDAYAEPNVEAEVRSRSC